MRRKEAANNRAMTKRKKTMHLAFCVFYLTHRQQVYPFRQFKFDHNIFSEQYLLELNLPLNWAEHE